MRSKVESGWSVLERELKAEQAGTLARGAGEVERTIAALRDAPAEGATRARLLDEAARAVWHYFVQREACGILHHEPVIEAFAIPGAVLARLGAGSGGR